MSGETRVTIVGNLTADPELRFTPQGHAVASFTVAATPRVFDKQRNEYVDGEPLFMPVQVWRQQAENVAESFVKGDRVVVVGTLGTSRWETREGEQRSRLQMTADEVAGSAKFAAVKSQRAAKSSQQQSRADDPWASSSTFNDEPPF